MEINMFNFTVYYLGTHLKDFYTALLFHMIKPINLILLTEHNFVWNLGNFSKLYG